MKIKKYSAAMILIFVVLSLTSPLYINKITELYDEYTAYSIDVNSRKQIEKFYNNSGVTDQEKFHHAVLEGDMIKVSEFINRGADVKVPDEYGFMAIHTAAMKGYADIVKLLKEKGAGVDDRDQSGRTPLMLATQYGRLDIVKYLIASGAAINAKDFYGHTALEAALETGEQETAEYLLKSGAKNKGTK